jgi:hypothetical protein
VEDLAELYLSRFKYANSFGNDEVNLLKKLWRLRVAISDFVLEGILKKSVDFYYQEKKAEIYVIKSKSIQKAFFELDSRSDNRDLERNLIIEDLQNGCQIAKSIQHFNIQINACTELWNFYQKYYKGQANSYWTSIFEKLYTSLQESTMLNDYSLYKYVAATYSWMLLKETPVAAPINIAKETSKAKPAKGNAKGPAAKEDAPSSNLVQAEEIINDALIKSPYTVESQLFLVSVWCQMHCAKSEKSPEPISNVDQITELFSSLEISGLPQERREGVSVDNLLKRMILTALTSADLSSILQIEIIARISQFAITERYFSTASGCLEAGFEVLSSSTQLSCALREVRFVF